MPRMVYAAEWLRPWTRRSSAFDGSATIAARSARCSPISIRTSSGHDRPLTSNQLLPVNANVRRVSPVSRRCTAYFQYAAWTAISQML